MDTNGISYSFKIKLYHIGALTITDEKVFLYLNPSKGVPSRYKKQEHLVENREAAHINYLHQIPDSRVGQNGLFASGHTYCFVVKSKGDISRWYFEHKAIPKEWIIRAKEEIHYCQLHCIGKTEKCLL